MACLESDLNHLSPLPPQRQTRAEWAGILTDDHFRLGQVLVERNNGPSLSWGPFTREVVTEWYCLSRVLGGFAVDCMVKERSRNANKKGQPVHRLTSRACQPYRPRPGGGIGASDSGCGDLYGFSYGLGFGGSYLVTPGPTALPEWFLPILSGVPYRKAVVASSPSRRLSVDAVGGWTPGVGSALPGRRIGA
jgi:hypothetical protein